MDGDKKIDELDSAGAIAGTELVPVSQSGSTFKVLLSVITTFINTGVAKLTAIQTLTKTRVKTQVTENTYDATLTPDIDTSRFFSQTAITSGITIANPSGTAYNGEQLTFRLKANGAYAITWGGKYLNYGTAPPANTATNKTIHVTFLYESTGDNYLCIHVATQP
jgi:hypothetical protein